MLGRVVEHAAFALANDVFQGCIREGIAFEQIVQVLHIGCVVLAMVIGEGLGAHPGLEGVTCEGQVGEGVGHGNAGIRG